ncbi:hypothetical protein Tco_0656032 [Tanacetum coccineum]|uniref:Uncharacterized protein n=1 Tax=Tanacetum coccineum TaxID=301880 RepID=A0ABQ4X850_9ASTR
MFGTIPTTIPDTTLSVTSPTTHIDTTPIPTTSPTIPPSPDYTPASPDYSPASDTEFDPSEDLSSDHIPPLPATSPFLSSTDDSLGTSGALRRRVMILALGQPIPHGRPYHYHLNRPVHMMTVRKRVGPIPTHALSDSASSCSSSDHSLPASSSSSGMRPSHHLFSLVPSVHRSSATISERPYHDSSSASPYRKRSRSPVASVPLSSPIPRALSSVRDDLLPSPKRIRSHEPVTDLEDCSEDSFEPYVPREVRLGVDFEDEEIDECFAYADALRDRGIDARVIVEAIDREEIETGMRGPVKVRVDRVTHPVGADDIPKPVQEGAVEVTYETLGDLVQRFHDHTEEIPVHCIQAIESVQRDQGHKIVATGQQSADMLERIGELEWDNRRLKDIVDVESQRVTRFRRRELRVQRELRQIRRFRFYDRMRIASLESCVRRHLGYRS